MRAAGIADYLRDQILKSSSSLTPGDARALLLSQSVLEQYQTPEDLLQSAGILLQGGYPTDAFLCQQLVCLYCTQHKWTDALRTLEHLASQSKQQQASSQTTASLPQARYSPAASTHGLWQQGASSSPLYMRQQPKPDAVGLHSDAVWHIIMRCLVHSGAPDDIVSEFVGRMPARLLPRFKVMYGFRELQEGVYTVAVQQELLQDSTTPGDATAAPIADQGLAQAASASSILTHSSSSSTMSSSSTGECEAVAESSKESMSVLATDMDSPIGANAKIAVDVAPRAQTQQRPDLNMYRQPRFVEQYPAAYISNAALAI